MYGLIGKKIKMTQMFNDSGHLIPVTLVSAGPCTVSQIKTSEKDGYEAIQLAFGTKSLRRINKPMQGHLNKANLKSASTIAEFKSLDDFDYQIGQQFDSSMFNIGEVINIKSISKGKGFAGTIKRHNFSRSDATHGNKHTERAPGSIGQSSDPSRVFRGMRMAGRKGSDYVTVKNLVIMDIDRDNNVLYIKGAIPGSNNSTIYILKK
jgi:large subunit ribosomal protein L3